VNVTDPPLSLDSLSKEDLIQRIEDLQEELNLSRVFNTSPESGLADATLHWRGRNRFLAEKIIPVALKVVTSENFQQEQGDHRIIDGDNLAVMTSLLTEFRGGPNRGIDVVYMDPPYNTGEDVFSYTDDYRLTNAEVKNLRRRVGRPENLVSLDDPNRHTKWINHIAPRLWAARKLLKTTGVIIVSIDEHELPRLWILMEEIFGPNNRLGTLIWERSRKNDSKYFSEGHEYMLVWARNKPELEAKMGRMALEKEWAATRGRWRKRKDGVDAILTAYSEAKQEFGDDVGQIQNAMAAFFKSLPKGHSARKIRYKKVNKYGMYSDDGNLNWPGGGGPRYQVLHPTTGKAVKVPKSGWRFSEEEMARLILEKRIAFKDDHTGVPRLISYLEEMESEVQTSVINKSGQRSVEVVEAIMGKGVFKNPKDHELLAGLFNLVTWRDKNAIILDPYAGSGTSGHAVLSLNLEDNGTRRFILIESGDPKNDAKIARDRYVSELTAERMRRVISGQWADGEHHPAHHTGFHFYRAKGEITKKAIMASTRESLADIILQVVEDESNRVDCRVEGYEYIIGKTRLGYGIALVWSADGRKTDPLLTWATLDKILDEATAAGAQYPIHIYASGNTAPISDDLYKFHQIPNSILARLGILDGEEGDEP
jgi:adenine-specific DNA-methyltransferase